METNLPEYIPEPERNEDIIPKGFYLIPNAAGIAFIVYVYVLNFDRYSETELLELAPIWAFLSSFGVYGYTAQGMTAKIDRFLTNTPVITKIIRFPFYGPFLILKSRNSLLVAIAGAGCWALLLRVFIKEIFPLL